MKKASLFVVAVVCVLAIVIITFFGQAVEMGQFHITINEITITNEQSSGTIRMSYSDNVDADGYAYVYLHCEISPAEADDPNAYRFQLDGDVDPDIAGITEDRGVVYFSQPYMVTARVVATDGGGAWTTVRIWCS
ncbi:MAG: hypothetical protein LUD29_05335 [Clostridia bacterium]|nr:hypothetical protein [Clostridia bacterium]